MALMWVLSNALMCCFFVYAGVVQLNDPDASLWISLYMLGALNCLFALFSVHHQTVHSFRSASGVVVGMKLLWHLKEFGFDLSPTTEPGREAGGLVILACWILVTYLASSSSELKSVNNENDGSGFVQFALVGLSIGVLAAVYVIPKFVLTQEHVSGHCHGIGLTPVT